MLSIARAALYAAIPLELLLVVLLVSGVEVPAPVVVAAEAVVAGALILEGAVGVLLWTTARRAGAGGRAALRFAAEQLVPTPVRRVAGFEAKGLVSGRARKFFGGESGSDLQRLVRESTWKYGGDRGGCHADSHLVARLARALDRQATEELGLPCGNLIKEVIVSADAISECRLPDYQLTEKLVMPSNALRKRCVSGHQDGDGVGDSGQRPALLDLRLAESVLGAVDRVDRSPHPCGVPVGHGSESPGVSGLVPQACHLLAEGGHLGSHIVQIAHIVQMCHTGRQAGDQSRDQEGPQACLL